MTFILLVASCEYFHTAKSLYFIHHDTAYEGRNQETSSRQASLLTDHMVFTPKYQGKILTGEVAMITVGIQDMQRTGY
jgi:hypothetical protein